MRHRVRQDIGHASSNWTRFLTSYRVGASRMLRPEHELEEIFAPIEHSRTSDEVVHQIESLILEGIFRAGDRLPGERELSRQFDVSRPILRDALKELEARGLLVTRHGGGTHVADIIGEVFTRPVLDLIATHKKASNTGANSRPWPRNMPRGARRRTTGQCWPTCSAG